MFSRQRQINAGAVGGKSLEDCVNGRYHTACQGENRTWSVFGAPVSLPVPALFAGMLSGASCVVAGLGHALWLLSPPFRRGSLFNMYVEFSMYCA